MVHEIVKSKYRIFIETLFFTLLILLIGFLLGVLIEYSRTNEIISDYKDFEVRGMDLRLQNYYYQVMDESLCREAINQNLIFADDIYNEGLLIQKYEDANDLSEGLLLEKKRYVLLKTELWFNSILLKNKCNEPFHTVVYIYSQTNDLVKEAEQDSISKTLQKIKEEKGNQIILIPIAGDIGLDIVDTQLRTYNITYLPSVLIDEKYLLNGFQKEEDILKYLN
jgi:hypothetical protein